MNSFTNGERGDRTWQIALYGLSCYQHFVFSGLPLLKYLRFNPFLRQEARADRFYQPNQQLV